MAKHREVDDLEVKRKTKKRKARTKSKSKAQWPHWKSPFQPGSNLHLFSQAMMKKGGLDQKKFTRMIKKTGAKASWIIKCMRKGSAGGWTWDFDDSHDRYSMTNVKLHRKEV